ncbi:MAG: cache domain-containing protein [Desulfobacterales bacterium]|nr:cache domain-containing protein [Desulfobacterales bacterium]
MYIPKKIKSLDIDKKRPPLFLKKLPVRIVIPVALTIILFILTIFLLIIPLLEKNMMDGKREGIMHLTENAWSTLNLFYEKARDGEISHKTAKKQAIGHLQQLRYGPELKDYFWINDMTPNMIMHPYRLDLVGQDVSNFKDPAGKRLFFEMVKIVKTQGAGYVDYLWQWKGDSKKIVPKISYVKEFQPWGWVIGTGIYVEDVREEISAITQKLTYTCSGIMVLFLMLSGYIIWQGTKAEKERINAMEQSSLREKQLLQADKMASLGILVAGVAHEINNPATSLMLNATNLKKAWQSFTPVLDEYYMENKDAVVCSMPYAELRKRIDLMLKALEDGVARIKKIISELKDFSRTTEADMDNEIDINLVVKKSLDLTHSILKKATNHLSVDYEDELPKISGNSQKLQQVIINLLVNASQALENPEQSIHVQTSQTPGSHFIVIEVSDSGPGVLPKNLKKMKDPFFTTKRDDGGTGLGLSISEKIVNDHKGILEFISEFGNGLTVKILLPSSRQDTIVKKDGIQ